MVAVHPHHNPPPGVGAAHQAEQPKKLPPPVSTAPLGIYAKPSPIARAHASGSPAAVALGSDVPVPQRLRKAFDDFVADKDPVVDAEDLRTLQAIVLRSAQSLFTNQFDNDGDLKARIAEKQKAYGDPPAWLDDHVFGNRDMLTKQQDCLNFILRTFQRREEQDNLLRAAALQKLGEIGRRRDLRAIMPYVRKGTAADLYHGLNAVKQIANRRGSPQERGGLEHDPEIGPLLAKPALSDEEKTRVIEAVLQRGTITEMEKLKGGSNYNEVYFVTFKETVPRPDGKREAIRGVFKPERTWVDKDRAYFSREVAAYEFDRSFARTGLVPPTVEAVISMNGGHELGSLQYLIPRSTPLGYRVIDHGGERWEYHSQHLPLLETPELKAQLAKLRTVLFVLSDPDKVQCNVKSQPNLGNLLVDDQKKLWMIDNSYSMGAAPQVDAGILPKKSEPEVLEAIESADPAVVVDALDDYVSPKDAKDVAQRMKRAIEELRKRPILS
jgi:hypothetical protein